MGRPRGGLSASGSSCMARPAGVHDASERQSQGVLSTGLLLFALSRTKKAPPARSWCVCHQRWISRDFDIRRGSTMFLVISYRNVLTEVFGRMWLARVHKLFSLANS